MIRGWAWKYLTSALHPGRGVPTTSSTALDAVSMFSCRVHLVDPWDQKSPQTPDFR